MDSISRLLRTDDPVWVSECLDSYCTLLGVSAPVDAINLSRGFEAARRQVHELHELPYPGSIELLECRLEVGGVSVDGSVSGGRVGSAFSPFIELKKPILPGLEARLRYHGGSMRVLILKSTRQEVVIARAPNRPERRVHERAVVSGVAVVRFSEADQGAEMLDISDGGVGLSAPFAIELGSKINLMLRIEGKSALPLECDGVVVSCRRVSSDPLGKNRIGIEFTNVPESVRSRIRKISRRD